MHAMEDDLAQKKNEPNVKFDGKDPWCLYIKETMQFLAKHSWIYNFKNTDIFLTDVLQNIPDEWKEPLLNLNWDDWNKVPSGLIKDDWPSSLKVFIEEASSYHLSQIYPSFPSDLDIPSFILRKMPQKKLAEVKCMALLISDVCQKLQCSVVLDIGSGLGYLDQVLHHNFGFTVIGLDSVASRTSSAETRIQEGHCHKNVHYSTYLVDDSDECVHYLQSLLKEVLKNKAACTCGASRKQEDKIRDCGVIMVGLHSCGSLVHHMMKLLLKLPEVQAFLCVGCCYHRMATTEFPISNTAKDALSSTRCSYPEWLPCVYGFRLGSQNSRSHWALRNAEEHMMHSKYVTFSGILQYFLNKGNLVWKKPKRHFFRLTPTSSFEDFVSLVVKDMNFNDSEKEQEIQRLLDIYQSKEYLFSSIRIIALLQALLQPVWEGLITADRVIFLKENNIDSKIIVLCNELITPRNLAIYGVR